MFSIKEIKKGLKIAFEHEMVLNNCYPDSIVEPKWVTLYNEWINQKGEYTQRFMTNKDLEQCSNFIKDIANGVQSTIEKYKI